MAYVVELPLDADGEGAGQVVKVEVQEQPSDGLVKVARPGQVVARATRTMGDMLSGVRPVAQQLVNTFGEMAYGPQGSVQDGVVPDSGSGQLMACGDQRHVDVTCAGGDAQRIGKIIHPLLHLLVSLRLQQLLASYFSMRSRSTAGWATSMVQRSYQHANASGFGFPARGLRTLPA